MRQLCRKNVCENFINWTSREKCVVNSRSDKRRKFENFLCGRLLRFATQKYS